MKEKNIFKANLDEQRKRIEIIETLLDSNKEHLIEPLWNDICEWFNQVQEALEEGRTRFN